MKITQVMLLSMIIALGCFADDGSQCGLAKQYTISTPNRDILLYAVSTLAKQSGFEVTLSRTKKENVYIWEPTDGFNVVVVLHPEAMQLLVPYPGIEVSLQDVNRWNHKHAQSGYAYLYKNAAHLQTFLSFQGGKTANSLLLEMQMFVVNCAQFHHYSTTQE